MNVLTFLVILCSCLAQYSCDYESDCKVRGAEKLDGFVVTWSPPNVTNPYGFNRFPKTIKEAEEQKWMLLDDGCKDPSLQHTGKRYILGEDKSVLIIYDGQGHVAGIQGAIPKDMADNIKEVDYSQLTTMYYENLGGLEHYVLTMYFIDPDSVCTGRTDEQVEAEGTASQLYIKNGTDSYYAPPMTEDLDALASQNWLNALCVDTMGEHYSQNTTYLVPYFTVYNCGRLQGLQLFLIGNVSVDPRFEHTPKELMKPFVVRLPDNINKIYEENTSGFTCFHVFFSRKPEETTCPKRT